MPLIIITGVPASGKTKRANQLKEHFEKEGKEVHIVSEREQIKKAGFDKDNFYKDSGKEKQIRGLLKSEVARIITPTNLVILDGPNYIKGYRYELYCVTKANNSTQCTIQTEINRDEAWKFNIDREDESEIYSKSTFDELVMRYEDPHVNNRWDAPLFITFPDQDLQIEDIYKALFKTKAPPPNMSTQNPPLSDTNYLYEMNKKVKEITSALIQLVQKGQRKEVEIPGYSPLCINLRNVEMKQLITLSRQYLTYAKMHTPDIENVPQLYIQFLKSQLN